jgi:hypothetical protein
MEGKDRNYIFWIMVHMAIGAAVFLVPFVSKVYGYSIIMVGLYYIVRTRNENHQALYVCAYMVGSEVLLRMTDGNPVYEFSKYGVVFFLIVAMYYKGFSKYAIPYWIFLVLLIPGVVISTQVLDFDAELRKSISFNISGPLCLGISSLYMYNRRISMSQLNDLLLIVGMPIVSTTVYLIFYTPNVRDVITGTSSNYETSGGFGPNQVSTMLGLGMFIFFIRIMMFSKSKMVLALNMLIFLNVSYRGLMTFSRGGVITATCMMIILTVVIYQKLNPKGRTKLQGISALFGILILGIWLYSANETGGLIQKRYANQDAVGRVKESRLSGRENIMASEIKFFMDNPIFGVGVARGAELRSEAAGTTILSHNEITRMLSEHGGLGILALVILFCTPLFLYLDNRSHVYLLCFVCFWLFTINHAAMRLAAPSFIYALSVLKVYKDEETVIRRE